MDELDPAKSAEEDAAADAPEKTAAAKERRRRMSRASLVVVALFLSWLFAVAAVADPTFFKRAVAICLSLATRLANGTRSADYALEAIVCVGAVGLLRVALKNPSPTRLPMVDRFHLRQILVLLLPLLAHPQRVRAPRARTRGCRGGSILRSRRRARRRRGALVVRHSRREDGAGRAGPRRRARVPQLAGAAVHAQDVRSGGGGRRCRRSVWRVSTNFRTWRRTR